MKANKIQVFLIMLATALATLVAGLIVIFCGLVFRKKARRIFDFCAKSWSIVLFAIVRAKYKISGKFKPKKGKQYVVMSNHVSHYDIPLLFIALKTSLRMVAKTELKKVPILAQAIQWNDFVFVDRNNRKKAIENLEVVKQNMQEGIVPWIAPEGTRSRTGELGTFKKGGFMIALQTGAMIIPVGIRGTEKILPPKTWNFFLRQKVEARIGDPIDASTYSIEQRDDLIALVSEKIRKLSAD